MKGEADINWMDAEQRSGFLQTVVADADRVLAIVRQRRGELMSRIGLL